MKIRSLAAALAVAALCWVSLPASTPIMPLSEVKPGMVGVGRTVFAGTELRDFKVTIIGVLKNVQGPRRDLIIAKLEGGPLAETGVAAGMSGSPVYIDGRLVGAVGYSIGAFPKEAIAGITPIEEMKEATAQASTRRAAVKTPIALPVTSETFEAALKASYAALSAPGMSSSPDTLGISRTDAAHLAANLRPIAIPLVMSGFTPDAVQLATRMFSDAGLAPVLSGFGGAASREVNDSMKGPLREGDALGVALTYGDMQMGATGTVTHIDGNRVYAFGHPFFNLGPSQLPLTRAYVHSMLPSLMSSFKITSMGEVIGTIQQDRATAISGTLGVKPVTIPMTITLRSTRDGVVVPRTFAFQVANDQTFTPLISYITLYNALAAYERQFGTATFALKGRAAVKGHADVAFEDVFAGEAPALATATSIAGPLSMVLGNDREPVVFDKLEFTIDATESPRTAVIERVWIDELRPRAGRTVPLKILTRGYRGEEKISTVALAIPAHATGSLSVMVSDGRQLNAVEQRELRRSFQPQSVEQMIRVLNTTRRNNRIYVRLLAGAPGAVVNGEAMAALPPSVLAVLEADRNGGSFSPIRSATLGEYEIPMDVAVSGSRTLTIDVESR
jgi:hypothetical protein